MPAAVELAVAAVEEAVQSAETDAGEAVDWWKLAAGVQDVAADQSVAQLEIAAAVEGNVLNLMAVIQHVDSIQYRRWGQAPAAGAVWTWADGVCAELRAGAAMGDGELVAADQHTATACQQSPPVLVHAHHQEGEGEAAEADLHMQEG